MKTNDAPDPKEVEDRITRRPFSTLTGSLSRQELGTSGDINMDDRMTIAEAAEFDGVGVDQIREQIQKKQSHPVAVLDRLGFREVYISQEWGFVTMQKRKGSLIRQVEIGVDGTVNGELLDVWLIDNGYKQEGK